MATTFKLAEGQKKEADALKLALSWVVKQSERDDKGMLLCPYCGTATIVDSDDALMAHIGELHVNKAVEDFDAQKIGAFSDNMENEAEEDELSALMKLGINLEPGIDDDLYGFDHFEMPKEMKAREKKEGGRYRFVTPGKFSHWKNQGAQTVERPAELSPVSQQSREDTTFRANEMVLMWFPKALCDKRDRARQHRVDDQTRGLISSQEQRSRQISDVGKIIYEHYRKRKMPHDNAMRMARKVEQQYNAGTLRVQSNGRASDTDTQITHTRTP